MTVLERFLRYIKVDTQSDPHTGLNPSTPGQMDFALMLCEELRRIGLQDAEVDGNGYVMASLPSNVEREVPVVGFIAHIDTSPELSGRNVNPQIIEHYMGNDIVLNKERDLVLAVDDFPELKHYVGQTLVTTDGNTHLGADGKAGVAEIMSAMEYLVQHPELKHGKIAVCFTPDEEIGEGADYFDVKRFGARFAYTLDGGGLGELQFENFNAGISRYKNR